MLHFPWQSQVTRGGGLFHSLRFELFFVFLIGVLLPAVTAIGIQPVALLENQAIAVSVTGAALAAGLVIFAMRQIRRYPGAYVAKSILPTLGALYGLLLSAILLLRLEYSNTILLFSFLGTLAARYALATLRVNGVQPTYFMVPGGRVGLVNDLDDLSLLRLERPAIPRTGRQIAFIADLHHDHGPEWERFLAEAAIQGFPVYHYKQLWEARAGRVQIEHLSENGFGSLVPTLGYNKIKRLFDLVLALAFLPLLALIFLVVSVAIKLDSPGPAFFRQYRMGYRGREFQVLKFRTMNVLHDGKDQARSVTTDGDERITRLGRFLRQTRIDELPQVYNILRGEMSWIGPRPEAIGLSHGYEKQIPFYRYRHIVRPGISGWAQVNQGHVTSLFDVNAKLQYDFYYIKNVSYWLDILIVFKTIRTVLNGFGAK